MQWLSYLSIYIYITYYTEKSLSFAEVSTGVPKGNAKKSKRGGRCEEGRHEDALFFTFPFGIPAGASTEERAENHFRNIIVMVIHFLEIVQFP